jgi:tetratricopeptide (TPR) repeat protein
MCTWAADRAEFARRAELAFRTSQKLCEADPANATNAWQFARACFDWAEFATNNSQKADIATLGIDAARKATLNSPTLAAGHYYLGLNLGQLAQTKMWGALRLVEEMEKAIKASAALDSQFDYAGADRTLGMLYLDAPGWPASIGSNAKARTHLQRAVELSPDLPDNRLSLIEALIKLGDKKRLAEELPALEKLLPVARKKFTGESWEVSWADWDKRWKAIQKKTGRSP